MNGRMEARRFNHTTEKTRSRRYEYVAEVDGTAARVLNPVEREQETREVVREPRRHQYKKKEKAGGWDAVSFLIIFGAIAITMYTCITFLQLQQNVTYLSKSVAKTESQVVELQKQNDEAYNIVDASVDLSNIYEVATKELGMVRAKQNQKKSYVNEKSDFVRQYGDVRNYD
ncbi:MAG: hypothetical protein K6G65_00855 [Lachnospiraceae bacterium]|nr:hypothetical protein [Lachnospiraceae bacterium]